MCPKNKIKKIIYLVVILLLGIILWRIFFPAKVRYYWSTSVPSTKVDLSLSPLTASVWPELDLSLNLNFNPEITNLSASKENKSQFKKLETSLNLPKLDDTLPILAPDDFYR